MIVRERERAATLMESDGRVLELINIIEHVTHGRTESHHRLHRRRRVATADATAAARDKTHRSNVDLESFRAKIGAHKVSNELVRTNSANWPSILN